MTIPAVSLSHLAVVGSLAKLDRSKDLQNLEFIFTPCHDLIDLTEIYAYTEDGDENPEYKAFFEKECGAIPEGAPNKDTYYWDR